MNVLIFLLIGLIAGWLAGQIVKGHGLGTVGDIIVGVIGAFVGGFIFDIVGVQAYGIWGSIGMSVVGAVVFLFVVSLLAGTHTRKPLS